MAVYLVAIATILLLPPTAEIRIASFARVGQDYFGNVGPALSRLFGVPGLVLDTRLTSLLAFVYTYHYLNWFIKADVIRWTAVPKARLAAMAAASAVSTALYFYDYAFGFTFLLALSLIHILLEFPLDSLALAAAWRGRSGRIARAVRRARRSLRDALARSTGTPSLETVPPVALIIPPRAFVDTQPAARSSSR